MQYGEKSNDGWDDGWDDESDEKEDIYPQDEISIIELIRKQPGVFGILNELWRGNKDIVLEAVLSDPFNSNYMTNDLKIDTNFIMTLLQNSYQKDHDIRNLQIIYNGFIEAYESVNNNDPGFYFIQRAKQKEQQKVAAILKQYY